MTSPDAPRAWAPPRVAALDGLAPSPGRMLLGRWSVRHILVAVALTPVVLAWFRQFLAPGAVPTAGWWAGLVLAAALGAGTLASYLPAPRRADAPRAGACGAPAGFLVVLAALSLGSGAATPLAVLPAVLLTGTALATRLVTAAVCR